MRKFSVLFIIILGFFFFVNPVIGQKKKDNRKILSIIIPAAKTDQLKVGLSFTGLDFYRWTGIAGAKVNSFRLLRKKNQVIPLQIEECDGTGIPKSKGNGKIDDDDRFVFAIKLLPKKQKIFLYYDDKRYLPKSKQVPAIKISEKPKKKCDLVLTSPLLKIGMRGGGTVETKLENLGRGCLALFEWKGNKFANIDKYWGSYFPKTLGTGKEGPVWSKPEVVINGPVRTLVTMSCKGFIQKEKDKEVFKGDIIRVIAVWDKIPVVDFEDVVKYRSKKYDNRWTYSMDFPCGNQLSEQVQLIVPLADQAYSLSVIPSREYYQEHPYETLYKTDNPEEGWFAVVNRKEEVGLGVFYEKLASIRNRSRWLAYRPDLHPSFQYIRTQPGEKIEVIFNFIDRAFRCRTEFRRQFRYVGLGPEQPEAVRKLYYSWALPLNQFAKVIWNHQ